MAGHYNVKAFGAKGDGVTNDSTAVSNAIAAAWAKRAPVCFPYTPLGYYLNSTVDLTPYPGTHFIGEGSRPTTNGAVQGVVITGSSSVSPQFKYDGDGAVSASLTFEGLAFQGPECVVRASDTANVHFRDCTFYVPDTGGANNTGVLLENAFWIWFERCHFNAPSTATGDAAVILRGKEPSVNVDHCYLIKFQNCRFWYNGVLYKDQNDITPDASHAEFIEFEDCETESFASTSSLIYFTKTASTNWAAAGRYVKNLSLRNIAFYDYSGSPPVVRFDVPNGINGWVAENIKAPRLFQRDSGTGGLQKGFKAGQEAVWALKDSSGTNLAVQGIDASDDLLQVMGTGTATASVVIWSSATAYVQIFSGSGSPEGVVTANVGSLFLRTDGGLYVKQTGSGNTGWVLK